MYEKMKLLSVSMLLVFAGGCLATRCYVDPQYRKATQSDIKAVGAKHNVNVDVEFQRNGERFPRADGELRMQVEKALRATGVVDIVTAPSDTKIRVVANNIADMDEAFSKGFGTGLTFGAAGSVVTDFYEIKVEFASGGAKQSFAYKHAIHTTVGNKPAPIPVEPTKVGEAFGVVIEDVILNFVRDVQVGGGLTYMFRGDGSAERMMLAAHR